VSFFILIIAPQRQKVESWLKSRPEEMLSLLSRVILAELRAKDLLAPQQETAQASLF
jgi:hypothetical protein